MFDYSRKRTSRCRMVTFFRQQGVPTEQIVTCAIKATANGFRSSGFATRSRKERRLAVSLLPGTATNPTKVTRIWQAMMPSDDVLGGCQFYPHRHRAFLQGSRAFLALDNCYSGALVEAVRERKESFSYAALTPRPRINLPQASGHLLKGCSPRCAAESVRRCEQRLRDHTGRTGNSGERRHVFRRESTHRVHCDGRL